jgi:hypothetical protein
LPALAYEAMMVLIEDVELLKLIQARLEEETVTVTVIAVGKQNRNDVYNIALSWLDR